jgi:hypothetical protein
MQIVTCNLPKVCFEVHCKFHAQKNESCEDVIKSFFYCKMWIEP